MPRATQILTNFTAGELSPKLDARIDLAKYQNACKTLQNMLIHPQGGVSRRPGTYYVASAKYGSKRCRLVPFEFSVTQAYVLEFGDQYIRVFKDNGQVTTVDSYTKLLLHCNGDDASRTFEDEGTTVHTVTAYGDAQVDDAERKFGSGAALFNEGYLSVPAHADFDMNSGIWTIDFRVRFTSLPGSEQCFFSQHVDDNNFIRGSLGGPEGARKIQFDSALAGVRQAYFEASWVEPVVDTSYHIAFIRGWGGNANDCAITVDGIQIGTTTTDSNDWPNTAGAFEIGRWNSDIYGPDYLKAHLDEFRVSKGIARWTADFTPPDREYPSEMTGGGGGGTVVEITTPYLESELRYLQFAQSADTLYITHPNHAPRKLTRTSHVNWLLSVIDFIDGPYEDEVTAVITSSAVSGQTTITLDAEGTHTLLYDAEVGAFTVGQIVTGQTSEATAKIMAISDWGGEAGLILGAVTGTFQNNEQITDPVTGDATVNGTLGNIRMAYNSEVGGPFEVGETITGGTSGAIGTLRGLQDDGASGKLVLESVGTIDFILGELLTGGTSEATGTLTLVVKNHPPLFSDTDVGCPFGYYALTGDNGSAWYWMEIKTITDDVTAVAVVRGDDIPAGPANASKYRKGAWKQDDYPSSVTFHEERLVFAGSPSHPQTFWGSEAGDYETFTPGTGESNPFTYTIGSNQVNGIRWLSSGRVLMIGTIGGEFPVRGTGTEEPITPTNILVRGETNYGSDAVQPLRIGHVILFLQRHGKKVRELVYNFDIDGYVAPDMTILADHITVGKIKEMAYQQEPDSILWAIRNDGELIGLTYYRPEEVIGWHEHTTEGYFESVAVIPSDTQDQIWVSVRRVIDGTTYRYIEYFTLTEWDEVTDSIYVDSALTYSGGSVSTLSGLDHLEGKTVSILTDIGVHPDQTVLDGAITLDWSVTKAHVGLPFTSTLQTVRLESGQAEGTAQGKTKRVHKATVRLYKTLGCKVGPNTTDLDTIAFREVGDPMDQLPPVFTGDKEISFRGGYEKEGYMYFVQDQPLPMTVLGVIAHLRTSDD